MGTRKERRKIVCPYCDGVHSYSLNIDVDTIFYHPDINNAQEKGKSFTVLLTCPKKNELFQVEIPIIEKHGEIVNSVEMSRVIDE